MLLALFGLVLLVCQINGRPLVRNLRTHEEYTRLIQHHKENTGMGVIIDFYSDGCGPCRQIAPHYLEMAKKYKDQVVFAKIDVNGNRETSSKQQIRSMPTFQFYMNGKKKHQFSGGDLQQLQTWASGFATEFRQSNVKVSHEDLMSFYAQHAPEKAEHTHVSKVISKAGGEQGGKGHRNLMKALKKKYGMEPKYSPRTKMETKKAAPVKSQKCDDLSQFDLKDLYAEVMKREEELDDMREEEEESRENKNDLSTTFQVWQPSGVPELVVILGGGPAGLSAAIYAARSGLRPVVIAPNGGGQLQGKGVLVENYPGVIGSTGPSVVYAIQEQAAKYGTNFLDEMAVKVTTSKNGVHTVITNTSSIETHTLIIATGADSRWLGVIGEDEYKGGGVSSCATCDGYLFRDEPVVVIGGGDTAMEEALHLATTSSKVTIIHRGFAFEKASVVLSSRVLGHPKIDILWNTQVVEFKGRDSSLTHLVIENVTENTRMDLYCMGAFIAIGHDPNTHLFHGQLDMNTEGYIVTEGGSTHTSCAGVFAAGDVADHVYRQAITSAGTGAMAALDAEHWIYENGVKDDLQEKDDEYMEEVLKEVKSEKQEL